MIITAVKETLKKFYQKALLFFAQEYSEYIGATAQSAETKQSQILGVETAV
jgi:hypothetical protein